MLAKKKNKIDKKTEIYCNLLLFNKSSWYVKFQPSLQSA